jgi:hypothetical protein
MTTMAGAPVGEGALFNAAAISRDQIIRCQIFGLARIA